MDTKEQFKAYMKEALQAISLSLKEEQLERFYQFYKALVETNRSLNLTAITEEKEVIHKHFTDSLSLIKVVKDLGEKPYKIIDVGTGAGFPGIPLAIVFENLDFLLLDSLQKRLHFIDQVCVDLGIGNVKTIHGRAEDYARKEDYREKFDFAVSRAVANLSTLSELCAPFVKVKGYFVAYKSEKAEEELKNAERAFSLLSLELEEKKDFYTEDGAKRSLLKIYKQKETSLGYPRKAGTPEKKPL